MKTRISPFAAALLAFVVAFVFAGCSNVKNVSQDIYGTCVAITGAENAVVAYQTWVMHGASVAADAQGTAGSPAYVAAYTAFWNAHAIPPKTMGLIDAAIAFKNPICEHDPEPTSVSDVDWAALVNAMVQLKAGVAFTLASGRFKP